MKKTKYTVPETTVVALENKCSLLAGSNEGGSENESYSFVPGQNDNPFGDQLS